MSNGDLDWARPSTWRAMLDRSACGSGTCAVMAVRHARGDLALGEPFVHESILGSTFTGRLLAETEVRAPRQRGRRRTHRRPP
jgi:proline racemase